MKLEQIRIPCLQKAASFTEIITRSGIAQNDKNS